MTLSKTIAGTDTENVFDITLEVTTTTEVSELYQEPDMAVVIVMDISNTMTKQYGSTTRYAAAISAAEDFIDQFAEETGGISQIGFVAFNSDATEIFDLTGCSTQAQAVALKDTMRTQTGAIIQKYSPNLTSNNYYLTKRFTNIEAGLKMAADMLDGAANENKYIIFLSDGFPTTYIKSGYIGWNPYMNASWNPDYSSLTKTQGTDGYFYDGVKGKECNGTSYSDKAAIRAREMATGIKADGIHIFSIGVDVGGQTITGYEPEKVNNTYVIDRTGDSYEIGSADNAESFKNWLRGTASTGIGSGYYYDSTDETSLKEAYESIFQEIQSLNEASAQAKWVASDPLPPFSEGTDTTVEFLGFFDSQGDLKVCPPTFTLTGEAAEGGENTAGYADSESAIRWDLKNSGYTSVTAGGVTTSTYTLTYRVRLQNEAEEFAEGTAYATNGNASLTYQTLTTTGGVTTLSEEKTLAFPVPTVQRYLGELNFQKVDQFGDAVAGAVFTLTHDADACGFCRGDDAASVVLEDRTATSDESGAVCFSGIPSGHAYILTETNVPEGYTASADTYAVTVSYDAVSVTVTDGDGQERAWSSASDSVIVNEREIEYEVNVYKHSGGAPLSGAEFLFYYTDAGVTYYAVVENSVLTGWTTERTDAAVLISGEDGMIYLKGLDAGNYMLEETRAPDGYNRLDQPIAVAVGGNVVSHDVRVENIRGVELPQAGGVGTGPYTATGGSFCGIASLYFFLRRLRRG